MVAEGVGGGPVLVLEDLPVVEGLVESAHLVGVHAAPDGGLRVRVRALRHRERARLLVLLHVDRVLVARGVWGWGVGWGGGCQSEILFIAVLMLLFFINVY